MKKIAIDLRPLQTSHQDRGIGAYVVNLLSQLPSDNKYIFLRYDSSNPITENRPNKDLDYEEIVYKHVELEKSVYGALRYVAANYSPKYYKLLKFWPDVFLQTDYLLGLPKIPGVKTVVIAYDLIPFIFRRAYIPSFKHHRNKREMSLKKRIYENMQYFRLHINVKRNVFALLKIFYLRLQYSKGMRTLKSANKIISISETTTNDLKNIAKIKSNKIETIYIAPSFKSHKNIASKKEIEALTKKDYVIYIGGTDFRKKTEELVYAFNILNGRGNNIHLVLAGNEFKEDYKLLAPETKLAIEKSSYKSKIHLLGRINDQDKSILYKNAIALVYPTLYEGFGLPIVEAYYHGCPVIAFDTPATREIGGKVINLTDSYSSLSIYKQILKVKRSNNPKKTAEEMKKIASTYTWDKTVEKTINAILN